MGSSAVAWWWSGLLLALIERRERLVPKHELLDIVWCGQVVEEGNLHVQVSTLRKLLGPAAITTIPGRGYRFVALLEADRGANGADAAHSDVPVPGERRFLIESEAGLCSCLFLTERFDECIALGQAVVARDGGVVFGSMVVLLRYLMLAQACSGHLPAARQTLLEALPRWRRYGLMLASGPLAVVLAELGAHADAARAGAAANAHLRRLDFAWHPSMPQLNVRRQALLAAAGCSSDDLLRWQREGEALDEAATAAICLRAVQTTPTAQAPSPHP